jgi:hypothetical protein
MKFKKDIIVVQAPNEDYSAETAIKNVKIFIAGGIQLCPNWQKDFIELVKNYYWNPAFPYRFTNITFYNPRRDEYELNEKHDIEQIVWEDKHLKEADIIVFWFSKGGHNMITLYEYGRWGTSGLKENIVVGVHPKYSRKHDVEIQTALSRPEIEIQDNLEDLVSKLFSVVRNKYNVIEK